MKVRQAASPRSRSVEAPMSPKLHPEEGLDVEHLGSPLPGSSPHGCGTPRQRAASPEHLSALPRVGSGGQSGGQFIGGDGDALPSDPQEVDPATFRPISATDVQLSQLQQRLEDMYTTEGNQSRGRTYRKLDASGTIRHVNSSGSIVSMGSQGASDSGEEGDGAGRSRRPRMASSGSDGFASMTSADFPDFAEREGFGGDIEFDLNIEEEPTNQAYPSRKGKNRSNQGSPATQPCPAGPSQLLANMQRTEPVRPPQSSAQGYGGNAVSSAASLPVSGNNKIIRIEQASVPPPLAQQEPELLVPRGEEPAAQQLQPQQPPGQPWQRGLPPKEYRHGHVPKTVNLAEQFEKKSSVGDQRPPTTLMIRNIPNRYTQNELILELEALGFAGTFDFLYVPLDKGTMSNVGYAFVNFVLPQWAEKCMQSFQGYHFKKHRKVSGKIAAVSVAHIQGLEANLAHYKNAAVNTAKMKQRRPLVMANISSCLTRGLGDAPPGGAPVSVMEEFRPT